MIPAKLILKVLLSPHFFLPCLDTGIFSYKYYIPDIETHTFDKQLVKK